jgi:gamma-glutamyltranspeptidase / glutathione hydrolase
MISQPARRTAGAFLVACAGAHALLAQDSSQVVSSRRGLVVSVSAPASDAGASVLARGGNAVDAAVATAFALAVTHPSAGNIGGGGFMVIRQANGTATTIDYRERAPLKADSMLFAPGGTLIRALGDTGYLSAGVPGTVRGLELAHRKYGKLPWAQVVQPAVQLASRGWPLSSALARAINSTVHGRSARYPSTVEAYGKPGGGDWQPGDTIRLPALAHTLSEIATKGAAVFYTGWIADSIDAQTRAHHGVMTRRDLAAYAAVERPPVRGSFLGYDILAMGPPTSGGQVVIETLNLLEKLGVGTMEPQSAAYLFALIEATRRAYYDRARFLGDADFVQVPLDRLLSKAYADSLAAAIDLSHATRSVDLGSEIVTAHESDETTHFSVVDAQGMAVSNTFTLQNGWGNGIVVRGAGFLLNDEMGDFNRLPGVTNARGDIGTPANIIEPGKRMLSSMSPVILSRNGKLFLVTGSPGGRTIPNTVLDVILGVTAFHMNVREAVDAPRLHHQWLPDTTTIEPGGASDDVLAALRAKGERVGLARGRNQGDAHSIVYDPATGTAYGANDKRSPDSKASKP